MASEVEALKRMPLEERLVFALHLLADARPLLERLGLDEDPRGADLISWLDALRLKAEEIQADPVSRHRFRRLHLVP